MTMPPELTPGELSGELARLQRRDEDLIEQMGLIMNGWKADAASRRTAASRGSPGGGARVVNYGAYNEGYADALTACAEALKLLRDHLEETS